MKFKRQWFRPGRRTEMLRTLPSHPFFTRKRADALPPGSTPPRGRLMLAAESVGAVFSLTITVVMLFVIAGFAWAFVQELRRETVVIEAFAVPTDLAAQGFSPLVISERISDEIRRIQTDSTTVRARRRLDSVNALADIQVAGAGVSMKSLVRYSRQWFGIPESTVGGEIVRDHGDLVLYVRERGSGPAVVTQVRSTTGSLDDLLRNGAREIVRHVDPYTLAAHLSSIEFPAGEFPLTLAAIRYTLAHPPSDDDPWAFNLWGLVLLRKGDAAGAVAKYQAALKLRPGFGPALVNWAELLAAHGDREEALGKAREALTREPDNPIYVLLVADILASLGRYEEAEPGFARAAALDPRNPRILSAWTQMALAQGRYAVAEAKARAAMAAGNDDPVSYVAMYWMLRAGDREQDAMDAMLASRSTELKRRQSTTVYAYTALFEGKPAGALALFEYELTFFPTDPIVWTGKGDALHALGRESDALASYDRAVHFAAASSEADLGAAAALEAMGRTADAAQRFRMAAEAHPRQPRVHREWGRFLARQGDEPAGREHIAHAEQLMRQALLAQ